MLPTLHAFKPSGTEKAPITVVDRDADHISRARRPLRCAACGQPITDSGHGASIQGAHEHRFMNPDGFLFDIGLFREAPGCRFRGVPTREFSWFAGYTWRHANCRRCDTHLGWLFEAGEWDHFVGLVLNRLTEGDEADDA